MYLTLAQLCDRPGPRELAQVSTPEARRIVADDLMAASLTGGDRSAWSAADIAVADLAVASIQSAIDDAIATIDGYLATRYALPLSPVPPIVAGWARAITRYKLHKDRVSDEKSDPIVRDYKDALSFLSLTATGKFSLGMDDPVNSANAPVTDVLIAASSAVFGRGELGSFR